MGVGEGAGTDGTGRNQLSAPTLAPMLGTGGQVSTRSDERIVSKGNVHFCRIKLYSEVKAVARDISSKSRCVSSVSDAGENLNLKEDGSSLWLLPKYVKRFVDALENAKFDSLQLHLCQPPVRGERGILTSSRIKYNEDKMNRLGRQHEFTFHLPDQRLELSLQLYQNVANHWRLFCYTKRGMLFSVNLTLLHPKETTAIVLEQAVAIVSRKMSKEERYERREQLCKALSHLGLQIDGSRLVLGTFDVRPGTFIDTTPSAFVRDFVLASLVKGHFMGNKDYSLPGLATFKHAREHVSRDAGSTHKRAIPLGLRYEVLERDGGRCLLCGRSPVDGIQLHVDHVIPWSKGGRTELSNLQTLCQECNLGKGNRSETPFFGNSEAKSESGP